MRYAKYKKTGIAWLPEVPNGWEVVSFGRMLETPLTYGASESGEVEYAPGMVRYIRITDITLDGKLKDDGCKYLAFENAKGVMLAKGDVLFARSGATVGKTYLFDEDFPACYAGYLIRASVDRRKLLPNFLIYFTQSYQYNEWKNRIFIQSTIQNISAAKYGKLPIPLPPLSEQRVIAGYLDEKCGKVDALVAAKERQVELLKEMKQSMIADAVTKGVGFNAEKQRRREAENETSRTSRTSREKTKPSGIPWLPEVPEGWEVRKMKYLFTERSDKGHPNEPPLCSTQAYGVIPQSKYEGRVVVVDAKNRDQLKLVKKGDFVISLRAFQGGIEIAHYQGIISAAYTILASKDEAYSQYFRWLFKSQPFIELLKTCVTGIREGQNINYSLLSRKQLPLPPLAEQKAIVAHIEERAAKIDATISGLQKEISLLKEYRERLIADVVTGQRRVNSSTNRAVGAVDGSSTNRVVGAAANNGGAAISAATKKDTAKGVAR